MVLPPHAGCWAVIAFMTIAHRSDAVSGARRPTENPPGRGVGSGCRDQFDHREPGVGEGMHLCTCCRDQEPPAWCLGRRACGVVGQDARANGPYREGSWPEESCD